jgi:hypothetical protein
MGWVGEQHTHQRGVTGKRERPADSTETLKIKNKKIFVGRYTRPGNGFFGR